MKSPSAKKDQRLTARTATWLLTLGLISGGLLNSVHLGASQLISSEEARPEAWQRVGLSAEEAAAHLLDRFSFGPRPGEVARVAKLGPGVWLEQQLAAQLPETQLEERLAPLDSLKLSATEIVATYQSAGQLLRQAQREGSLPKGMAEQVERMAEGEENDSEDPEADRRRMMRELVALGRERGLRPQRRLTAELMSQKLYRALYAENQLSEVMTNFWYNHFYVSILDTQARPFILPYERDAVRPRALGSFRQLLGASARHPAMLLYLDNFNSTAATGTRTTFDYAVDRSRLSPRMKTAARARTQRGGRRRGGRQRGQSGQLAKATEQRLRGLNENYARELLELHTLGVDGGYTQDDVIEVARAFTGWTALPPGASREKAERRMSQARTAGLGFVFDGEFIFRATTHDAGKKQILGHKLPAGRGIEDGDEVLDLLASHPSTAHHIARKLAVRFVCDEPSDELVDRLAEVFSSQHGDTAAIIRALVDSDEFWAAENRGAKIKSPFELATSALRALDATVVQPEEMLRWISRMGQPLYAYGAPTGYPDSADGWVNSGSLLNRMNFGLELAAGRIDGVDFDLAALNGGREPESRRAALETYLRLLLPAGDQEETLALLTPVVEDRELVEKVAGAAQPGSEEEETTDSLRYYGAVQFDATAEQLREERLLSRRRRRNPRRTRIQPPTALEQVVGVILGSPAFQRR